jgi:hypothetical protein
MYYTVGQRRHKGSEVIIETRACILLLEKRPKCIDGMSHIGSMEINKSN